jgi:hypothetical protein
MLKQRKIMETEKKPRSLQRELGPGPRGEFTLGTIYYKGYKMIFPQGMLIKNGESHQGVLLRCALIKPLEENSTPGSLKAWHVSLVKPVTYLGVAWGLH